MLGASDPVSQKDWYPHPKKGLRSISQLAKSQINLRPEKLGSPYRIPASLYISKPNSLDNAAQQNAIDNRTIAGETRILFPAINEKPARNGAKSAKPNDVFEWLSTRSMIAVTTTIIPKTCRRPRQIISRSANKKAIAANCPRAFLSETYPR